MTEYGSAHPGVFARVFHAQMRPIIWGGVPVMFLLYWLVSLVVVVLLCVALQPSWPWMVGVAVVKLMIYVAVQCVTKYDAHGFEIYCRWLLYREHYGES